MDYYAILGVDPTAEDIVIRAAYKALAQRYHPDRFVGSKDEAHRRMSDLTKAYDVLADPVRRQKYDRRRLTYTQSVATYFNSSPKYAPPALDPRDLRSAAAKRKRSRIALSALMIAVSVLTAFNLLQYSAQLKEWLSASMPAPSTPLVANTRRTTDASVTGTVGTAPGASPQTAFAAKTPTSSIGQRGATAVETAAPKAQTPTPQRPDSATAAETLLAKRPGEIPVRHPAANASRAAAASAAVPSANVPLLKEERRASARNAQAARPTRTPPAVAASETCRDTVAALGLCSPNKTARNR